MAIKRTVKSAAPKAAAPKETTTGTITGTEAERPNDAAPADQIGGATADGDGLAPAAETAASTEPPDGLVTASIGTVRGVLRFRRAGMGFGPQPRTVQLRPEQLAALQAEPMLSVMLVEEDA